MITSPLLSVLAPKLVDVLHTVAGASLLVALARPEIGIAEGHAAASLMQTGAAIAAYYPILAAVLWVVVGAVAVANGGRPLARAV
jgi:hypothetical protein